MNFSSLARILCLRKYGFQAHGNQQLVDEERSIPNLLGGNEKGCCFQGVLVTVTNMLLRRHPHGQAAHQLTDVLDGHYEYERPVETRRGYIVLMHVTLVYPYLAQPVNAGPRNQRVGWAAYVDYRGGLPGLKRFQYGCCITSSSAVSILAFATASTA